jgi:hypothetical protein
MIEVLLDASALVRRQFVIDACREQRENPMAFLGERFYVDGGHHERLARQAERAKAKPHGVASISSTSAISW